MVGVDGSPASRLHDCDYSAMAQAGHRYVPRCYFVVVALPAGLMVVAQCRRARSTVQQGDDSHHRTSDSCSYRSMSTSNVRPVVRRRLPFSETFRPVIRTTLLSLRWPPGEIDAATIASCGMRNASRFGSRR